MRSEIFARVVGCAQVEEPWSTGRRFMLYWNVFQVEYAESRLYRYALPRSLVISLRMNLLLVVLSLPGFWGDGSSQNFQGPEALTTNRWMPRKPRSRRIHNVQFGDFGTFPPASAVIAGGNIRNPPPPTDQP